MRPYKSYEWPLTAREYEVCDLVMKGLSAKEIGRLLGISHRTVESCRHIACRKLGVRTGIQMFRRLAEMKADSAACV
jgi:DNA-binding CsgD family transcriptional regulator